MYENMPEQWREITGTDPSWMPRIIAVLMEDYRPIWDMAVSLAIDRNAAEQVAKRAAAAAELLRAAEGPELEREQVTIARLQAEGVIWP